MSINQQKSIQAAEAVLYEKKDNIAIITLNRPQKYNAINLSLKEGILDALAKAQNDDAIGAVVLTGNGKGFCAGADLADFRQEATPHDVRNDLMLYYANIVKRIIEMNKPVICGINGPVAGAGIGFALACDFKIMAETASMRYAFINIALVPDAGSSWFLLRAVGYTKAMEIISGGEKIPSDECLRLGLVNKVVARDQVFEETIALATKLANGPTNALARTKEILNYGLTHGLNDTMDFEARQQAHCIGQPDNQEGIRAFLQKRKPNFTGGMNDES